MGLPPFEAGAVHETVTVVFPAMAVTEVGAPGPVYGTTPLDAAEDTDVPRAFVAVAENVYVVPGLSPETVQVVADVVVHVEPPGEAVTV
jgi:hypothetical protein